MTTPPRIIGTPVLTADGAIVCPGAVVFVLMGMNSKIIESRCVESIIKAGAIFTNGTLRSGNQCYADRANAEKAAGEKQ